MINVSVIIPNYNHSPYLKERIESVLNQSYQNFELIILDDCSTDNSKEIIELYHNHDKVSHIIYNDTNTGSTFKQWEKGINLAKGEWIWIAESDDWCEPCFLEVLFDSIKKYNDVGLAYCNSLLINVLDNTIDPYRSTSKVEEFITGNEYLVTKMIPYNNLVNASMAIFKKEIYYKISSEYTNYKLAGDWIFWVEISRHCNVVIVGKFLNYFRQHSIKVSVDTKKIGLNYYEIVNCLSYFKELYNIKKDLYNDALIKHYFRFKYEKFPFNEGVITNTELLFRSKFDSKTAKKVKSITFKHKINYKYLPKIFKYLFNDN